jgi:hypothetical protein
MTCASACALIWLAGARRYVWDTAKIGFHGAFDAVTMEGSGPGNAIVGAYLNKLGLSYQAIVYMTAASPTDMRWLHSDDAKRWGVAAENFGTEWKLKSEAVTERMLECMATGIVDWVAKSPERSTGVGSSRFSFYLGKVSPEGVITNL